MKAFRWSSMTKAVVSTLAMVAGLAMMVGAMRCDAAATETRSGPLVFAGSGSNLAITRLLAEAFRRIRPEVTIEIPASIGSGAGIRAASDGAIAVALISRPLRESEQGLGLTVVPYARTAVVVGANPAVADDGLTFEELVQIYKGLKTRWSDEREIVVLTREAGDSSLEVLEQKIPGFSAASAESRRTRRWKTLYTDQEMTRMLAVTPYALGPSDLGTITAERSPIKVLKLEGMVPTPENVRSGRYRLVKTLAFAFRRDRLPPEAQAFVDFVRGSEGAKILQASAFVPGG
jgi:phosphate transport system substrate-binding protein